MPLPTNADTASSSYNTMPAEAEHENVYQFVENGGKFGRTKAYICLNGKVIKTSHEDTASCLYFFFKDFFKQVFLPVGYPESVSEDYIAYQLWDTVQAFCSTITGTFTTQSIMKSVGVGNESATALGAAITWIIRDGSGMIGRILFAWWQGSSLDSDCKYWRLFADVLNDMALIIEFTLPAWGLESNFYPLCLTSVMKSIVGVAGGATRAAITQHQAVRDNMGDVSAKDGSQETCVNLLASICGVFLLTYFEKKEILLTVVFLILTLTHVFANYKAVRALVFRHLNLSRFLVVFNSYLQFDAVPNPICVNKYESIFFPIFKHNPRYICGFKIKAGYSLQKPFNNLSEPQFDMIMKAFKGLKYIIVPDMEKRILYIALDQKIDSELMLRAHFHAIMLGMALSLYNNMPLGIKAKRQLHHVTSMQRLNNLLKKMRNPARNAQSMEIFTKENFITFNEFINAEALSFFTALSITNWEVTRNSLLVGEWRCSLIDDTENVGSSTTKSDEHGQKKDN